MRNLLSWPLARGHAKGWEAVMPVMLVCISHTGVAQESRDAGSLRGSSCLGLFCLASAWGLEQPVAVHCDFLREAVSQGELFKLRGVQDSLCKNYISFVPALKTRGYHMDVESCCIIWCLSCLW